MNSVRVVGTVRELHRSPEHRAATSFDVTVAVCFANSAATLGETLESLRGQRDAPPAELLLVTNATTDSSVEVALAGTTGLPVRLLECDSAGYDANARNVCMVEAAAPYLLFVDADDVVDDRFVASMAQALDSATLVTAQWELSRLNPHLLPPGHATPRPWTPALPFRRQGWTFAPAGTLGMRRTVPEQIGGFDPGLVYAANNEWCWRAFAAGHEVVPVPQAQVHYRLRGTPGAVLRQHYRWAVWEVAAAAAAAGHGLPRRGVRALGLGTALSLLRSLGHLHTRMGRRHAVALVAGAAGRVVGSVRFRRLDL